LIAILDYGSGNLRSAERAFATSGQDVVVTSNPVVALEADGLVVPGVGAFSSCMDGINAIDGASIVRERLKKDFVHSYAAKSPVGKAQSWSVYGEKFLSVVEDEYLSATQFHPEKSGTAGLALIKNWIGSL